MAATERIVSPGVFTRENDLTYLPQGISNIGACFIGPFSKGPAFAPTLVNSQADLEAYFGVPDGTYYTPYAAQQYIRNSNGCTIIRVGKLGGYHQKDPIIIYAVSGTVSGSTFVTSSGQEKQLITVLANTAYDSGENWDGFASSSISKQNTGSFNTTEYELSLYESGSTFYGKYKFSFDPGSPSYFASVFGGNPLVGTTPQASGSLPKAAYVYTYFDGTATEISNLVAASSSWEYRASTYDNIDPDTGATSLGYAMKFNDNIPGGGNETHAGSQFDITNAFTPYILSQNMDGTKYELFKIHTLSDGTAANTQYKINISDVRLAGTVPGSDYGSFTLTVRNYHDTDRSPNILESFQNLSMDPESPNYIARRIGDYYTEINSYGKVLEYGEYSNKSKFIRIEMSAAPYPLSAVPWGFRAYNTPIGGYFSDIIPAMKYTSASTYSQNPGRYASGVTFHAASAGADAELTSLYPSGNKTYASDDSSEFFAPIPATATKGNNVDFDLTVHCGLTSVFNGATDYADIRKRKFSFGFQGGFDGGCPAIYARLGKNMLPQNVQGLDCSSIISSGSVAYKQALAAIGNADEFDINLLAMPGITFKDHSYVSQLAIDTVENRGDAFLILDLHTDQTAGTAAQDNVIQQAFNIDSNYVGTYYPWVKILDTNTNKQIAVPPSVVMPGIYAQSDRIGEAWFAPAGLNRGGITQAIGVSDRLTHADRDRLYEGRINPIASFPGQGIVVWGQKTLQHRPSALDRINVRRLLIAIKKYISSVSRFLVFENNNSKTRNQFLSIVNPYLENVAQRNGIYAFKVVMDETNNTPDIIDRNILYGQLWIKPQRTAEFIVLDFNLLPTGASFPTA